MAKKVFVQPEQRIEPELRELNIKWIPPGTALVGGKKVQTDADYHLRPKLNIGELREQDVFSALQYMTPEDIMLIGEVMNRVKEKFLEKAGIQLQDEDELPPATKS